MTICKLCTLEKALIGKSHIIPNFLYEHSGLYDEMHRIRLFSVQEMIDGKKPSLPQSGVYEGNILCAECDNKRIGANLEQYAKKAIYGGGQLPLNECPECDNFTNEEMDTFAICKNLSYSKYKLFLLSILWRASISSKSFFKRINIGEHEEIIRKMIFENDPKKFDEYPIFVFSSALDEDFTSDIIVEPTQAVDDNGMLTCYFVIGGFIYIYKVGQFLGDKDRLKKQTITEENKMTILLMKTGETMNFLKKYVGL
jgi:hypothetical protein